MRELLAAFVNDLHDGCLIRFGVPEVKAVKPLNFLNYLPRTTGPTDGFSPGLED
jgi:hypothetical protein